MRLKIPFAPPGWTLRRVACYASKLGLFIVVPGLHQMACRRWMLGGLLLCLYLASGFVTTNRPVEFGVKHGFPMSLPETLSDITQLFSWILLAFDLGQLESRKLKFGLFIPVSLVVLLHFLPLHNGRILFIHVVVGNQVCGEFCKYDIVTYDPRVSKRNNVSVGDYILLKPSSVSPYLTRVVMVRSDAPCSPGMVQDLHSKLDYFSCIDGKRHNQYDFLVLGGSYSESQTSEDVRPIPISGGRLTGINLKKIGNTHEYFILTEEITDFVGNALLTIYKWTGINLFGPSSHESKTDRKKKAMEQM